MNIRTLLVDDEDLARRGLKIRLKNASDIEIVGEAAHGEEALRMADELRPDLMFLDIQMPGMNGFDVLKALAGKRMPMIVFVTAYDEYAVRAFDAHAIDYLLKPIDENRLEEALSHVREQWDRREAVQHRTRLLEIVAEMSGENSVSLDDKPILQLADKARALVQNPNDEINVVRRSRLAPGRRSYRPAEDRVDSALLARF